MSQLIESNLEFNEVLNAFPILKTELLSLNFNLNEIHEGESIKEYFIKKSYKLDEINLFIQKLNSDIKYFLKNGKLPQKNSSYSIGHEKIEIIN